MKLNETSLHFYSVAMVLGSSDDWHSSTGIVQSGNRSTNPYAIVFCVQDPDGSVREQAAESLGKVVEGFQRVGSPLAVGDPAVNPVLRIVHDCFLEHKKEGQQAAALTLQKVNCCVPSVPCYARK